MEQQNFHLFDQPLFTEDTPLPFKFWRDGIRQFIFRPGLRPDELLTFTLVALSDVEKQGEDTVAQLWRSPLDNLEYVVVEGFKVDGFSDEEVQIAVDKIVEYLYSRLRSHSDDFLRFARVSAEDLELKLEGVEQVRGAVIAGMTASDELKARLQKEIAEEEQSRLFPKLVSSIFQVAEAGVDDPELLEEMFLQLLDALLLQEDFAIINQIVLKLRAMEDRPGMSGIRRLKATFVEKMGEEQRLVRVADVLRAARPGLLPDIGRYLSSLQPTVLPILLDLLETLDAPEHRLVLCDVDRRVLQGESGGRRPAALLRAPDDGAGHGVRARARPAPGADAVLRAGAEAPEPGGPAGRDGHHRPGAEPRVAPAHRRGAQGRQRAGPGAGGAPAAGVRPRARVPGPGRGA